MVVRWLLVIAGWVLLETRTLATANGSLVLPGGAASQQAAEGATVQQVKLDSACSTDDECSSKVAFSVCDATTKKCQCSSAAPVTIGQDECLKGMHLDQPCTKNEQCLYYDKGSVCKKETSLCQCSSNHKPLNHTNGTLFCTVIISETKAHPPAEEAKVDVTMMAVLISLAVMFIIMCIVLRMFSKAQFRDQRTIFNSPRLMKKSLSKARAERRASHVSLGSRAGSRAGSRHASIQSGLNLAGSRESIALPNSNSVKHLAAPIAEDDDANSGSRKLAKSEDSPHVAIQTSNENIASV